MLGGAETLGYTLQRLNSGLGKTPALKCSEHVILIFFDLFVFLLSQAQKYPPQKHFCLEMMVLFPQVLLKGRKLLVFQKYAATNKQCMSCLFRK